MTELYLQRFQAWLGSAKVDEKTKEELLSIEKNQKEIQERFYKELEFGTGGLRGILGAGCNRMNVYTVRRTTQGIANYIRELGQAAMDKGVVISYDCRHFSEEFAMESAKVLAANGIKAYVFDEMRPTPILSFAVRHLQTSCGIMITASHNPANYNGYKVYGEDGAQLNVEASNDIIGYINAMDIFEDVISMEEGAAKAQGLIKTVGSEVGEVFYEQVLKCSMNGNAIAKVARQLKIVFTPFHGTGHKPVYEVLKRAGFENIYIVEEQAVKDPNFSTVKSPNPEEIEGFKMAIKLAKEVNADIIIGTDPDADRLGVLAKNADGEYDVLSGNQVGILLTEYILSEKQKNGTLKPGDYIVKTIVTTDLSNKIAEFYQVDWYEVFTGFKFIAEIIKSKENDGGNGNYLFGFEESYGYLPGTYARDKDAVAAALLICELAAVCHLAGLNLTQKLHELYDKYGYYIEKTISVTMEGMDGMADMAKLMEQTANNPPKEFGQTKVLAVRDYKKQIRTDFMTGEKTHIPMTSSVLYFELEGGGFFVLRPSGTEPKIKLYFSVTGESIADSEKKIAAMAEQVKKVLL